MLQGVSVTTTANYPEPLEPAPVPRRGAILVVEDRDDVRQGLAQLLELHGYLVFEAANAGEAFAHLESCTNGIALILLDLALPGCSGSEIRASQLANAQWADIPAIILSAYGPADTDSHALRPAAWFEKPFRVDQLLGEVRKHVA